MIAIEQVRKTLLSNDLTLFESDYGKKAVAESWTKRLSKQIKQLDQFKQYQNVNIITGTDSNIVDIDLDCPESNLLADAFLNATAMEFGKQSTPRAHRLYKVIDLNKKHTRTPFAFEDVTKSMLVELRANQHYSMCLGKHDNGEDLVWSKCDVPTEITYDVLHKQVSMLAVASVFLKKYPAKEHDEYVRYMVNTLYSHKVEKADAEQILLAVVAHSGCDNCYANGRVAADKYAKLGTYDKEESLARKGINGLVEKFGWTDKEKLDLKKLIYCISGRHILPEYTNTFVDRIAYMMKQGMYYDLEDKEMYNGEAIDVKYAKHFKNGKYTPLKFWKQHPDSKVCVDFTYKPDNDNRFVKVNKKLMINVYERNELQPDPKADTDLWDALWEHVVPHDDYRNHLLNWCAYHVQHKGKKVRHAVIMQSDEFQLGKGSLFDVMRDILGHDNTNKIDLKQALDKGKGYLINKQLVLIDEAKASGSWSEKSMFVNTLKTIITEGTAGVRQLYKEYTEQDTCTNYWINTNYRDAFPLPYNEARYFVYFSPAKRNEKLLEEYHIERQHGDLNAGVLAQLLDRDISKFNPLGVAPQTPYLLEMVKSADRPIADYIREQFNQGVHPFNRDLLSATELFSWLADNVRNVKVTRQNEIAQAFKSLGGKLIKGCKVKGLGSSVNVWCIRNQEKYKNMSAKEVGEKYKTFYTDSKNNTLFPPINRDPKQSK